MATKTKRMANVATNGTGKNGNGRAAAEQAPPAIIITRPKTERIKVKLVGESSLIVHAWSVKAVREMLGRQTGEAHKAREVKSPEQDYKDSLYISDEGWCGVPSAAFKAAIVGACRLVDGLSMVMAKRCIYVVPDGFSSQQGAELTRIKGDHHMRQDMVRLPNGSPDIRHRAEFSEWSAVLTVDFNASLFSREQAVNLIALAGFYEGVCEWRPSAPKSATGTHGRWTVE